MTARNGEQPQYDARLRGSHHQGLTPQSRKWLRRSAPACRLRVGSMQKTLKSGTAFQGFPVNRVGYTLRNPGEIRCRPMSCCQPGQARRRLASAPGDFSPELLMLSGDGTGQHTRANFVETIDG